MLETLQEQFTCFLKIQPRSEKIFNLASGEETTIQALANLIMQKLGLVKSIDFDGKIPSGIPVNWRADTQSLQELGFSTEVTLEKGIDIYAKWCQAEVIGW